MFGIITVKGNASGSRKPTRWIVHEAANAEHAWNAIIEASVTGSVGETVTLDETHCGGGITTLAHVQRICDVCKQPAKAYGTCHASAGAP